jgi:hypothetical protein
LGFTSPDGWIPKKKPNLRRDWQSGPIPGFTKQKPNSTVKEHTRRLVICNGATSSLRSVLPAQTAAEDSGDKTSGSRVFDFYDDLPVESVPSRLGVLSANQGDQENHNGQHQQNMNKSAHGMPGKQTDQPQQQEHDKCSSQHGNSGFLLYSNGPKEKGIPGYRRSAQTRDGRKRILHPDALVLHKGTSTRGDRKNFFALSISSRRMAAHLFAIAVFPSAHEYSYHCRYVLMT